MDSFLEAKRPQDARLCRAAAVPDARIWPPDPVLNRRERLPRALFPAVLKTGRRLSSPHFTVSISREVKGYAVVIQKKVARLSVTRHRIKRQVLAILASFDTPLPPALILFPKSSVSSVSYRDMKAEIEKLLSNIHYS